MTATATKAPKRPKATAKAGASFDTIQQPDDELFALPMNGELFDQLPADLRASLARYYEDAVQHEANVAATIQAIADHLARFDEVTGAEFRAGGPKLRAMMAEMEAARPTVLWDKTYLRRALLPHSVAHVRDCEQRLESAVAEELAHLASEGIGLDSFGGNEVRLRRHAEESPNVLAAKARLQRANELAHQLDTSRYQLVREAEQIEWPRFSGEQLILATLCGLIGREQPTPIDDPLFHHLVEKIKVDLGYGDTMLTASLQGVFEQIAHLVPNQGRGFARIMIHLSPALAQQAMPLVESLPATPEIRAWIEHQDHRKSKI